VEGRGPSQRICRSDRADSRPGAVTCSQEERCVRKEDSPGFYESDAVFRRAPELGPDIGLNVGPDAGFGGAVILQAFMAHGMCGKAAPCVTRRRDTAAEKPRISL